MDRPFHPGEQGVRFSAFFCSHETPLHVAFLLRSYFLSLPSGFVLSCRLRLEKKQLKKSPPGAVLFIERERAKFWAESLWRAIAMERTGCVNLPPGFRFHPTDEELVVQYLKRKVFSCPLPASIIPDIGLYRFDPWDLPGLPEKERYFFTVRETKYPNGSRPNRASASGFWKATGKDKPVHASRSNQLVGMKKSLVFYKGKAPNACKTDWIMHEYRLAAAVPPHRKNPTLGSAVRTEDWVLCRVFRKRRTVAKIAAREDLAAESEPSCVTDACEEDQGEISSSTSLFSSRHQGEC